MVTFYHLTVLRFFVYLFLFFKQNGSKPETVFPTETLTLSLFSMLLVILPKTPANEYDLEEYTAPRDGL